MPGKGAEVVTLHPCERCHNEPQEVDGPEGTQWEGFRLCGHCLADILLLPGGIDETVNNGL